MNMYFFNAEIHRQKVKEYRQKLKNEEAKNKDSEKVLKEENDEKVEYKFIPFLPYCNSETLKRYCVVFFKFV